jgi:hypothetical protein
LKKIKKEKKKQLEDDRKKREEEKANDFDISGMNTKMSKTQLQKLQSM